MDSDKIVEATELAALLLQTRKSAFIGGAVAAVGVLFGLRWYNKVQTEEIKRQLLKEQEEAQLRFQQYWAQNSQRPT